MPSPPADAARSIPTNPTTPPGLAARVVAEMVGTAYLLAAIVGSGIAADRLLPDDPGLVLAVNAVVTGAALTALIATLQPISAAFNPLVTLLDRWHGALTTRETLALVAAQLTGGLIGVTVANLMFDVPTVTIAGHERVGAGTLLGEAVASLGLLMVITVIVRTSRADRLASAVGAYIGAAVWFTSSTSFANPAVTIARTLTDTFTGIAPGAAAAFVAVQLATLVPAWLLVRRLAPGAASTVSSRGPGGRRGGSGSVSASGRPTPT